MKLLASYDIFKPVYLAAFTMHVYPVYRSCVFQCLSLDFMRSIAQNLCRKSK